MALRLAVAAACVLSAFCIRFLLSPELGDELPFMLFVAAALVAAWYGGGLGGFFALGLGLFMGGYFFLAVHPGWPKLQWFRLFRYLFTTSLGIILIEMLHRGRRAFQTKAVELAEEASRRRRSEEALLKARDQLKLHATELEHHVAERTDKLAATVESLEDVLYQMAHHLRAPLRAIDGYTFALVSEFDSALGATGREYAQLARDAARRMDALITALLDYGRLGHLDPPMTAVDPEKALALAREHLSNAIGRTHATVRVARPLIPVFANLDLLEFALSQLLDNALKFVAPATAPEVSIWSEYHDGKVRFWIEDNGIGVPAAFHERIFGAFERLHPVATYEGTGIGLAIVKQAIRRMNGQVGVQSRSGGGSRFWFELAAANQAVSDPGEQSDPESHALGA